MANEAFCRLPSWMILKLLGGLLVKNSFSIISACDLLNIPDFWGMTNSMFSLKYPEREDASPSLVASTMPDDKELCPYNAKQEPDTSISTNIIVLRSCIIIPLLMFLTLNMQKIIQLIQLFSQKYLNTKIKPYFYKDTKLYTNENKIGCYR
jgi:hypothetical protein